MKTKYYIVLQPSIRTMGGEEMYTRNIVVSARQKGYVPIVFHSGIGGDEIYIDELKAYSQYEFSAFRYELCIIPSYIKSRLIQRIRRVLVDYDKESIIETHEILIAEWGEWMASQLGIRHFAYMLLEHNTLSFYPLYEFFRFKYDRCELAGIVKSTIPDMFKNYCKKVKGYSLPAYCTNVYEDIPCPEQFKLEKADYTIGTIGRTNKQYVQPMIDSLINFISSHQDKTFNILYVGGSMEKKSEMLVKRRLSSIPNTKLTFTGMIFPLSIEMIRQMDVCVASAGSCLASYNCGIPTIALDGNDNKAIGVYGKTTKNILFRNEDEEPIEIEKILEEILIYKRYWREDRLKKVNVDFASHWDFLDRMVNEYAYYDIRKINYPLKRKVISVLLGYYYGLSPDSFKYSIINKCISLFS